MKSVLDKGWNGTCSRMTSSKKAKSIYNDDKTVFLPKKRRAMGTQKKLEMDKLFDLISDDPFYENQLPTQDDNTKNDPSDEPMSAKKRQIEMENQHLFLDDGKHTHWLYDDPSDDDDDDDDDVMDDAKTSTTENLSNLASQFLDQEQREQLQEALDSTDHNTVNGIHHRFFSDRCKLPNPHLKNEADKIKDPAILPKYEYLLKKYLSDTTRQLLSSDMLSLWYRRGWNCPNSVYQWLMEVVAFDKDLFVAQRAMFTLSSFWSNLPTVKLPLFPPMSDGASYDRNISIETFSHIMKSYGALNLPALQKGNSNEHNKATMTPTTTTNSVLDDNIPVIQLQWTLQLLTKSLLLWPESYSTSEMHYVAKILFGIGVDDLGGMILQTLEDCLQACLLALPLESWKNELQTLGCDLCEEYRSVELQVRVARVTKPECERCTYLLRVIALAALELAHIKDTERTTTQHRDSGQQHQSSKSQLPLPTTKLISSLMVSSTNIISRMVTIVHHSSSIFQQSNPDYQQLSYRIYMLDNAIGNDYAEFMSSTENVKILVTQLQALGRRTGVRLGALDKTKANEAIQRLWSRLVYVVNQNRKGVRDENL